MVRSGSNFNDDSPLAPFVLLSRVAAAIVVVISLRLSMLVYGVKVSDPYIVLMIISVLLSLILFHGPTTGTFMSQRFWSISLSIVSRWLLFFGILLTIGYATKVSATFSRLTLFTWLIATPALLILAQVGVEYLAMRYVLATHRAKRIVIAGANELGRTLAEKIETSPYIGAKIEGFFDDRSADRLGNDASVNVIGKLTELADYVRNYNIELIFVVLPLRNIQRVSELLDELHDTTASIYFVPDIFVFDLIQCRTGDIDGMPVISLCESPFQGTRGAIKKFSDYVIATGVLTLASPLFLAIAIAVKMSSPGQVIFKQRRYGLDGREIVVYKFRTMTVTEDDDGHIEQAKRNDPRVTKVGAFLRKYSLDELPQFFNVLQGRMSVVGPRPHAVAHNEEYRPLIKGYMVRHKVNPGITGLAQVHGFRGETATIESMRERVEWDLEYLRNWSLSMDLRIIFKTVTTMFSDDMAY